MQPLVDSRLRRTRRPNPVTALSHTQPGVRFGPRTYLIGAGATAALTAGILVVFLSLATYVAFNGLPFGGGANGDAGAAYLDSNVAPAEAGAALGAAHAAVVKSPVGT